MLEWKQRKEYLMSISIYKDVRVINREEDQKLKVAPIEGFSYASDVATCVVTVAEFFQAAQSQPVVFAKNEQGGYLALVVMALKDRKNIIMDYSSKANSSNVRGVGTFFVTWSNLGQLSSSNFKNVYDNLTEIES